MTKTKEKTRLQAKIFWAPNQLNKMMNALDMADGHTKYFGAWKEIDFSTTSEVTEEYTQGLIKHLLQDKEMILVCMNNFFAVKSDAQALSNGQQFLWVSDIRKALESANFKEVIIDDSNN